MAEPITPAEQRVLELLPTHLSNADIADRLCLAKATVKAHLRAIYRKLEGSLQSRGRRQGARARRAAALTPLIPPRRHK